ncbi:MAG: tetratricopeptide repeat protein [Candidatus Zixiibacteriota bacterium]|nr:MAG: tetratricopeptide repeat protein [candidate division Zixibacteria bacterium]
MKRPLISATAAGLITLILYGLARLIRLESAWGINQLLYLGDGWLWLPAVSMVSIVVVLTGRGYSDRIDRIGETISGVIFDRKGALTGVLLVMVVLFYLLRTPLHFTGDGYHLLNAFGGLSTYQTAVTKFGSVWLVRGVQSLFGEFTYESARSAFQIISIASGAVVVFAVVQIAGEITADPVKRALALVVLLFSGSMLIFFGHVEFYPMVWAVGSVWFWQCLRGLNRRPRLAVLVPLFLAGVFFHVEFFSFLPAMLYLVVLRAWPQLFASLRTSRFAAATVAIPALAVTWAATVNSSLADYLLPLTASNNTFASYGIFSWHHLHEVVNLVLAVSPGVLVIGGLLFSLRGFAAGKRSVHFLLLAAFGGISFVLIAQPALGMARDVDLMSLMLVPVILLLLQLIAASRDKVSGRAVVVVLLVCVTGTVSFLAVNLSRTASEERTLALLKHYGVRDRGGWLSLTAYLKTRPNRYLHGRAVSEMQRVFPGEAILPRIDSLVASGDLDEAYGLAVELHRRFPEDGTYVRTLADVLTRMHRYPEALSTYEQAVALRPDHVTYHGLGVLYQHMERYQDAVAAFEKAHRMSPRMVATIELLAASCLHIRDLERAERLGDTLFVIQPNCPGGHVVKMLTALAQGRIDTARTHYEAFARIGRGRPDYDDIVQTYASLLDNR